MYLVFVESFVNGPDVLPQDRFLLDSSREPRIKNRDMISGHQCFAVLLIVDVIYRICPVLVRPYHQIVVFGAKPARSLVQTA